MPYNFQIQGQINLETRRAYQIGLQLNQDLNRLIYNTSINSNNDNLIFANKYVLGLQSNLKAILESGEGLDNLG